MGKKLYMYFLQKGAACLLAATVVAALGGCAAPGEEESRLYKYMTSLRSEFPYRDSNPGAAIVWGSRVYDDGVRYEGEFNNGKRHGRGKQIWPDGAEYEGEYQNDKRNGQGTFTWPSKAKYEGDFVDGKRHGKGVFTWPNGARYEGSYVDSQRDGPGVFFHPPDTAGRVQKERQMWGMDQLISSSPLDETVAEPKVAPSALLPKEPVEVGNQLADTRLARSSDAPPLDKTPTKPASVAPTTTGSLPEISGIGTPSKTPVTTSAVSQTEIPTTKLWSDPETGISLAFIPGGCFSMGSEQESENENPVHEVCLDSFWMGVHEITQKQWRQVLNWLPEQSVLDDRFPVGNVSWQGVDEFLQAINKRSGIHFRLPTEAQWEYACTGGGLDKFYCGEGAVQELGWVEENSDHRPHAPGELVSNRFGLYDMTGNLWEWVADWYGADYYRHSPQRNPTGPASGTSRVFRGGGWLSKAGVIRATMRHDMDPHRSYPLMGLRLAAPRVLGVP